MYILKSINENIDITHNSKKKKYIRLINTDRIQISNVDPTI